MTITTAGNVDMTGALNVDPTNAGQINCMYLSAGSAIGGSVTTDTVNVNQTITNVTAGVGSISFLDSSPSTSFTLDAENGLTIYATSGANDSPDGPGSSGAFLSTDRFTGVVNVSRLNVDRGIVSPGNSLYPGVQSPQTGLFLWQYFR
jgi:hypothetical protein